MINHKRFLRGLTWPVLVCIALTIAKLWLIRAQTLCPVAPSPHDEEHFLSQAEALLQGNWLGYQGYLTLIKGSVYPLWLALNHHIGIPLLISQALLYAFACWAFVFALRPLLTSSWPGAVLYLFVLYNPASWDSTAATRLMRENIYHSLTLFFLASTIGAVLRVRNGVKVAIPWAVVAGVTGSLFVMTREEGVWVLPSILLIVLCGLVTYRKVTFRTWIASAVCGLVAYALPISAVAYENWRHYGVFETCETTAGYFKSAYGALTRVKPDNWNPYVPVPRDVRVKVFSVSPAYRRIGRTLEARAPGWIPHGCKALGICNDMAGGWFIWAFREAVDFAGIYDSGMSQAQDYYRRLTEEIDVACRGGQLDCLPARSTLLPPWRNEYFSPMLLSFLESCGFLATFQDISPKRIPVVGHAPDIRRFEKVTLERVPFTQCEMTGLVASRGGDIGGAIVVNNRIVDNNVRLEPVLLDAGPNVGGFKVWRFTVVTSEPKAELFIATEDQQQMRIPLAADAESTFWTNSVNFRLKLESFREEQNSKSIQPLAVFRVRVLTAITMLYSSLMPFLAVIALFVLLVRVVRDLATRLFHALTILTLALLAAVFVRLLMLSYINVSSFPSITTGYVSPAYALYVAGIIMVFVHEHEIRLGKHINAPIHKNGRANDERTDYSDAMPE